MNKWYEFYKSRIESTTYEDYFRKKYAPFIEYLDAQIHPGMKIGEFGCGTSLVTKVLHTNKCMFKVVDNNAGMLELTKLVLGNMRVEKKLHDITQPLDEKFDLIHSHGVLEHFEPYAISHIISMQLKACPHLVHYVPSKKYCKPSFGDEHLWTAEEWKKWVGVPEVKEFNDGYDLMLIWNYK